MDVLSKFLSNEALDTLVVPGISLAFVLIFFAPLLFVALVFWIYCAVARRSVTGVARSLSILWLFACVPAVLMILMGAAFNSRNAGSLFIIPMWVGLGLLLLWMPVGLRRLFGISPA
ncbi:MAG: hypothetical protein V4864_01900 [Pseudomonadota bacterium]